MANDTESKYRSIVYYARERGWGSARIAKVTGVAESTATRALRWGRANGLLAKRSPGSNLVEHAPIAPPPPFTCPPAITEDTGISAEIPEADTDTIDPFVFDGDGHGLILSDVHVPYHDRQALSLAVAAGKRVGANHIILDGDILDFYQASSFARTGSAKSISDELKLGRQLLRWLRDEFPRARIVYKVGNHEQRFERYLQTNARELEDLDDLSLPNLLRLSDVGAEIVAENQFLHYGHLTIIHGHEFRRSIFNPVNPARGAYLRAHACCIVAHHHQSSMHGEPDIRGELTTCWSLGCMCSLRPKYMPVNKWNLGFALIEKHANAFSVDNKRVIDGGVW